MMVGLMKTTGKCVKNLWTFD